MLPQIAAGNAIEIILASDLSRLPDFAKPDARHKSEGLMSQVSRPGTGGRQPRVPAGFESTATAELRRKLGEPTVETHMGSRLELWETDTDGNTVVAARLSSEDVQKGENAMAQIDGAFALCEEHGLKPRYVIAATRLSGETKIENRLDLQFMMRAVEQGQVDSIVYREVDRLSRNPKVGEDFFSYLKNAEATLYLTTEQPNKVDWEEGMLLLRIKSGVAAHERSVIKRRTFSALERRMLLAGKGWPGSKRFGFRRDAQKYLEVDPEQWDFVERIHFDYSRLGETGRGSLSALAKHMKSLGCSFSRERLRTILHDPIYVTGEWDVVVRDTRYPGRTVQIPRPIPAEVQARNIALLKNTKGRNGKTTPFGTFLLNHIPFYHSRCMDEKVEKKKNNGEIGLRTPMLRGRNPNGEPRKRPPCYCHVPRPPAGCKNFAVESEAVDDGVVNVLLGMAESPELQLAFINGTAGIREVEDVVEDVNELRRRLGSLKRKHDVLVRSFIDEPQNDDISEARGIAALLAGVENDMEALGNRIELAETTSPARGRAPSETLREAMQRILVLGDDPTDEDRQRRVALVASLVSKVVLHHGEEGLELEVFGHLIPTGQMMVSADLRVHMRNAVGGLPEPSTKGTRRPVITTAPAPSTRRRRWRCSSVTSDTSAPRTRPT